MNLEWKRRGEMMEKDGASGTRRAGESSSGEIGLKRASGGRQLTMGKYGSSCISPTTEIGLDTECI